MEDKFYWRTILSILILFGIILLMFYGFVNATNQIANDKDVWFNKDLRYESCSCSTEVPAYFDMCMEFTKRCQEELGKPLIEIYS